MASIAFPRRDPTAISSNASLAIRPRLPSPPPVKTDSIGAGQSVSNSASALTAEVIATFDVPGNWSGKGQHVEFARNEAIPLEQGAFLGRGAFADVHEVICRGVRIARKQIHCPRRMKIEDVKRELDILKKLNHKHVVTLLGSYTQGKVLSLLLHPVAVCDLGMFLDELDEEQRRDGTEVEVGEGLSKLMDRLGLPTTTNHARERLNKVYGCLASAVQYLHENDIRHKDLKPRNILLDRNNGLYVTDFGLSRDTTDASSSVTDGIERGTYKYCAPEVARYLPRGRAADVFTLGSVFLELTSVCRGFSLIEFDEFRCEGGDHSFQNNPKQLKDWMLKLRRTKIHIPNTHIGMFDIVDIIDKMVSPVPEDRPLIGSVCSSLYLLDQPAYFGNCCAKRRYQELVEDNKLLELELTQMNSHVNHIEDNHRREKRELSYQQDALLEKYNSLNSELWDKSNEIDVIRATHRLEMATIVSQHEHHLRAIKLQYENEHVLEIQKRENLTAIYEGKLQETYNRHMNELAEARKTKDNGNEFEQQLRHSRPVALPPTPPTPTPAKELSNLRPPILPPTPPTAAKESSNLSPLVLSTSLAPATQRSATPAKKNETEASSTEDELKTDKRSNTIGGIFLKTKRSLNFKGKRDSTTSLGADSSKPPHLYTLPEAAEGKSCLILN